MFVIKYHCNGIYSKHVLLAGVYKYDHEAKRKNHMKVGIYYLRAF